MKNKSAIIAVAVVLVVGGYFILKRPAQKAAPASKVPAAQNSAGSSQTATAPTPSQQDLILKTRNNQGLGTFLAASNGMTLYKYAPDQLGKSNCSGQCAVNWPPYVVSSATDLKADPAIKGAVTTIKRDDGSTQIAYNGMPLYFWINDKAPGDTTGQNVGGVWFVVNP